MKNIVAEKNSELLKTLDEEGILLSDYLMMLVEKMLIQQNLISPKSAENFLKEL